MKLRLARRHLAAVAVATLGLTPVLAACGPTVVGNPQDYSVNNYAGQVMRWNPCAPVHWRADLRLAPPGALTTVQQSVAALSAATGISFVYDGTATYIPQPSSTTQPAPLVVSFGRHSGQPLGSNYLTGSGQIGDGGYRAVGTWNGKAVIYRLTSSYVVIDADAYRFRSSQIKSSTLLHELGHAVGLNHARQASEVMYPVISPTTGTSYAAGDLTGFRLVGRSAGCL